MTATADRAVGRPHTRPPLDRRPDRALVATMPVLLAISCVKWGSYLGRPPIFLTDVLIAGAVSAMVVGRLLGGRPAGPERRVPGTFWSVAALLGYVGLRLLVSPDLSFVAIRDAAPYAYAGLALVAAPAYLRASPAGRQRTATLLRWGLLFHLAWVLVAHYLPAAVAAAPVVNAAQELRIFSLRGGTDATLVGVTGAYYLFRYLRTNRWSQFAVSLLCMVTVVHITSRAALLATTAALLVVTLAYYSVPTTSAVDRSRRLLVTAAMPLTLIAMAVALPYTAAGSKLLSGIGLTAATNAADRTGIGTQGARQQAWTLVIDYVGSVGAQVAGVGFGPDFLRQSGATVPLGNGENLRSPHNFLIGSYARLGLLGLLVLAVVLLLAIRALLVVVRSPGIDDLVLLAGLIMSALMVSSLFGVELESPFGAVPFFWSMGIILASAREHRRKEPTT